MSKTVTVAVFSSSMDIRMNLFRDMLEAANIDYVVVNENTRTIRGAFPIIAGNIGIEIRVKEEDAARAVEIYESIQ